MPLGEPRPYRTEAEANAPGAIDRECSQPCEDQRHAECGAVMPAVLARSGRYAGLWRPRWECNCHCHAPRASS